MKTRTNISIIAGVAVVVGAVAYSGFAKPINGKCHKFRGIDDTECELTKPQFGYCIVPNYPGPCVIP